MSQTPPDYFHPSYVRIWIDEQIRGKRFKNCGYLLMGSLTRGRGMTEETIYLPRCMRNSFEWKGISSVSQTFQTELWASGKWDLASCPKDCKFYRHTWVSRIFGFVPASWRWVKGELKPFFDWYAKLFGGTQMLIILLLILFLAPRWVPKVIELVKAIAGK